MLLLLALFIEALSGRGFTWDNNVKVIHIQIQEHEISLFDDDILICILIPECSILKM